MVPADFKKRYPVLEHYSPLELRLDLGLLTAAQLLDLNADKQGMVWARFASERDYRSYPKDHWKTHARFKRRAGEDGCNLLVRDATDSSRFYVLGNNYPLGTGKCLGSTIPLTDNWPGHSPPTSQGWFRILNGMFWVFDATRVNTGVIAHLRAASPDRSVVRLRLDTCALTDDEVEQKVRLSAINGGGSNGAPPRGTATYRRPSEWGLPGPPKEIGIVDGIKPRLLSELVRKGAVTVAHV
jgi:hypothetical protein